MINSRDSLQQGYYITISRCCFCKLQLVLGPPFTLTRFPLDRRINKKSIHSFVHAASLLFRRALSSSRLSSFRPRSRLLSFAYCFAPNLRPIIATEEAISNLNETPSCSRSPTPRSTGDAVSASRVARTGHGGRMHWKTLLYRNERAMATPVATNCSETAYTQLSMFLTRL